LKLSPGTPEPGGRFRARKRRYRRASGEADRLDSAAQSQGDAIGGSNLTTILEARSTTRCCPGIDPDTLRKQEDVSAGPISRRYFPERSNSKRREPPLR